MSGFILGMVVVVVAFGLGLAVGTAWGWKQGAKAANDKSFAERTMLQANLDKCRKELGGRPIAFDSDKTLPESEF